MNKKRLVRSRTNRRVMGTIGGLGEYFGLDENIITILRILYVILIFASSGTFIIIYFIASFVIPDDRPRNSQGFQNHYQNRYEEKWAKKQEKWQNRYQDKQDNWNAGNWENHSNSGRKIKEAEPIKDEKEEDWSDF